MKIKNHELQQIIKEELIGVIQEQEKKPFGTEGVPWKTVWRRLKRAVAKGFGSGENILSQAGTKAWGGTRVYAIDQLFKELTDALNDFRTHQEFKALSDPNVVRQGGERGSGKDPEKLMTELEETVQMVIQEWATMTIGMRGEEGEHPEADLPPEEETDAGGGEEDEAERERARKAMEHDPSWRRKHNPGDDEGIAEVIRRQVRREVKKRFIS